MKRLLKNNLLFFIVLFLFVVGAIVLLVMTLMSHAKMNEYIAKTQQIKEEIETLNRQKPSPHPENIKLIQADTAFYEQQAKALQQHFGRPLEPALAKFVEALRDLDGKSLTLAEFRAKFREEWESSGSGRETVAGRDQFYQRFKRKWQNWNAALGVFEEAVKPLLVEPVTSLNVEDILLDALGLPRNMGFQPENCLLFMSSIRYRLIDIYAKAKVQLEQDANNFGFKFEPAPPATEIVQTVKQWNIIGDLADRIAKSGVSSLERFTVRALDPVREGNYAFYHYTFEVRGTLKSLRELVRVLNAAYAENRVYLIRSIFLYNNYDPVAILLEEYAQQQNEALRLQALLNETGGGDRPVTSTPIPTPGSGRPMTGPGGRPMGPGGPMGQPERELTPLEQAELRRQQEELEMSLPYYERSSYGVPLFGGDDLKYRAVFDVEYVVRTDLDLN